MLSNIQTYPNADRARDTAHRHLEAAAAQGRRPVLLVESPTAVLHERKLLAQESIGFGICITTIKAWVQDLWELHGDGCSLVDPAARSILMAKLLKRQDGSLPATPGMTDMLVRCAQQALTRIDQPAQLAPNETAIVDILRDYARIIHEMGWLEPIEAMDILAASERLRPYAPVLFDMHPADLPCAECAFLEQLDTLAIIDGMELPAAAERDEELDSVQRMLFHRTAPIAPVAPTGAVRIGLAAGPTARNRLLFDIIANVANSHDGSGASIAVACKEPEALFSFCGPLLKQHGIRCELHARKRFADTDMGRALIDLAGLIESEKPDVLQAADYAYNPFAGIWHASAFRIDQLHRGNRLIEKDEVLSDLAGNADDMLKGIVSLIEEADYPIAFDTLQAFLDHRFAADAAYRTEQSRALAMAREACETAALLGEGLVSALQAIASRSMPITVETAAVTQRYVIFMDLQYASSLPPASVDVLVAADLNAPDYPVRADRDALQTLLEKWDFSQSDDPLRQARTAFYRAFESARTCVILQRVLNDSQASQVQPCTMFEEVLDCYRIDPTSYDDVNRTLGIPKSLEPFTIQAGEESLVRNATGRLPAKTAESELPAPGRISTSARGFIVLSQPRNQSSDGLDLSASQIESYLECPYQWFAKRRLKLEPLDEGFGPLERGLLIHDVLNSFYRRFQQEVQPKVADGTLAQAEVIMTETFRDEAYRHRYGKKRPGQRYAPIDAWEEQVRDSVLPHLVDYLEFETALLPSFTPLKMEWAYGDDSPFQYAGCNLCGRVDRIDVDAEGHAVVLDYKSSLSKDYRLRNPKQPDDAFRLPRKMQTLIYAKAVRDLLGYRVVGALYVNPITSEVQGAYDARVIGRQDIPFKTKGDADAGAVPFDAAASFDELVDRSEQLVAESMQHMAKGRIAPDPIGLEACRYCPVGVCPRRLEPRKR
jgi:ATP-dependent helicase/nuclease subunit B